MAISKVTSGGIAADVIDGTKIADNAVDTEHLADDAVDSAEIAAGAVDDAHLATGITASKLTGTLPAISGVNLTALNATNLGSGTVPTARLGSGTASSGTILYGDQTYKAAPTSFDPDGAQVFNETGADVDFRVEGSGNANALFVQGSDGDVGIGTGTPTYPFEVRKDQNAHTIAQIWNDTAGTGASTQLRMKSNSGLGILANLDDGYSSTGMYQAGTFAMMAASSSTGGLLLATESDHPIRFYQGAAEKCRITSAGLTFGGDTAAANALDDYEEGSWTPVVEGGSTAGTYTYAYNDGKYTKVGNLVHIWCNIGNISTGSAGSGNVLVTGLPFASSGSGAGVYGSSILTNWTIGGDGFAWAAIYGSDSKCYFEYGMSGATIQIGSKTSNGADIRFELFYMV